jgi:hypothetical protein
MHHACHRHILQVLPPHTDLLSQDGVRPRYHCPPLHLSLAVFKGSGLRKGVNILTVRAVQIGYGISPVRIDESLVMLLGYVIGSF